jgi:hypothetical protein
LQFPCVPSDGHHRIPDVYVSKEIVQRGDLAIFTQTQIESHLASAIKAPTDKISNSRGYFPTYRFLHDYFLHENMKIFSHLQYSGFTVNPEFTTGGK